MGFTFCKIGLIGTLWWHRYHCTMKYFKLLDFHLLFMYVIAKVFGNRPFIFPDDNATPHCSRKQIYGNRQTEFKP